MLWGEDLPGLNGENLGGFEPEGVEGAEVGGGDEGLEAILDGFQELVLSGEVKFGEYVVKEEERGFADDGFDEFEFGEFEG